MNRRSVNIPVWHILTLIFLVVFGVQMWQQIEKRKTHRLRVVLDEIQLQLERFAVDNNGSYPASLAYWSEEFPKNPYSAGQVKLLEPNDPWQPGGIVYVPWGPRVYDDKAEPKSGVLVDLDTYVLLAYGRRKHARDGPMVEAEDAPRETATD